jgi:5-methylcytosine-specific restriction protein A
MPKAPPVHRPFGKAKRPKVHQPASSTEQREREKFYKTARWLRTREAKLRRDPMCQACAAAGRITQASHVDHAVPIAQGGSLTDDAQLVSLCLPCHSRKTLRERQGKPAPPVAPSAERTFVIA